MKTITFPLINLKLNISPIAFSIGNIQIYWYGIIIVLACIIAIIIYKLNDKKFGINFSNILDLIIYIIPISIISARLYYVIFNLNYYIQNPIKILNIKQGRTCNIWGNNRWSNYLLYIMQKKENKFIRCIRLYSTRASYSDNQLVDGATL